MMQIASYKGKSRFFNRLCSWWLRGDYSHTELVLGYDAAGLAICASSSFMDGGVRVKHMRLNPEHWDLVPVAGRVEDAWAWVREYAGAPYDWLGLLGFIARVLGHDQTRFVCSEAVAAMLGFPDPWRFDPCSLHAALSRNQPAQAGFFTPGAEREN